MDGTDKEARRQRRIDRVVQIAAGMCAADWDKDRIPGWAAQMVDTIERTTPNPPEEPRDVYS